MPILSTIALAAAVLVGQDTIKPRLLNDSDVQDEALLNYPLLLRQAGVGGTTLLSVLVDSTGIAVREEVKRSAGHKQLDEVALRTARLMKFEPAAVYGRRVRAWADVAVHFPLQALGDTPRFVPYTKAPGVLNQGEVGAAIQRHYPSSLKSQRVEGTVTLWLQLDESGRLLQSRLRESSGYPALDEAALEVAKTIRFSPALNGGQPVKVWIQLPIVFRPGR